MSYRMPFPDPTFPAVIIVISLLGISTWVIETIFSAKSSIRAAHTNFVFSQIVSCLSETDEADFPSNNDDLIKLLENSAIDWNSCSLTQSAIKDGWGKSIQIAFNKDSATWRFRSAGHDGKFGSQDDLSTTTPKKLLEKDK